MPTVRELREQKNWSQQELASRATLSMQTISNIENGYAVQKSTIKLIALAFGVKPEEITGYEIVKVSNRAKS